MSLAEDVQTHVKKGRRKNGAFREQLRRYRAFKADMAAHGVELSEESYDIPLMGRLRRGGSRVKAKAEG